MHSAPLADDLCQLVETPLEEDFFEEYLQLLAALLPSYYPPAAHLTICATLLVHPKTRQVVLEDGQLAPVGGKEMDAKPLPGGARRKPKPTQPIKSEPFRISAQLAERAERILLRTLERHGSVPFTGVLGFSAVTVLQSTGRRKARKAAPRETGRYGVASMLAQGGFVSDDEQDPISSGKKRTRDSMDELLSEDEEEGYVHTEFAMATTESVFNKFDSFWELFRCSVTISAPEMSTRWLSLCDILIRVLEQDWKHRKQAAAGMSALASYGALDAAVELDRALIVELLKQGESSALTPGKLAKALLVDLQCDQLDWPHDPWRPQSDTHNRMDSPRLVRKRNAGQNGMSALACGAGREDACFSDFIERSGAAATFPKSTKEGEDSSDDDSPGTTHLDYNSDGDYESYAILKHDSAALWGHQASLPLRIRLMHLVADAAATLAAASGQPTSLGKRTGKLLHFNENDWLNALAQESAGPTALSGSAGPKHLGQLLALLSCWLQEALRHDEESHKRVALQRGEMLCALMLSQCSTLDAQAVGGKAKAGAPTRSNLFKQGLFTPGERTAALMGAKTQNAYAARIATSDFTASGRIIVLKTYMLVFGAFLGRCHVDESTKDAAFLVMDEGQLATYKMILLEGLNQGLQEEHDTRRPGKSGKSNKERKSAAPVTLTPVSGYRRREFRTASRKCIRMLNAI
ncbi:hypothetical protein BCR37DRAFT_395111 [Protomyces lactucae-debilis]|uniref:Uncharacterized protein n=1 Tax=Protomyces lactucae-debilis TaxID=2754530 RepID=A0A1Y2EZM8_PROLT|nr:uncharacterized protein BCR37DRAFT_395111 [Protomyces lactucae-debilis]ORY77030.1 hypothetical protein BCR37DRAFT_395111 [Protomyces lactucae-debilis]